jgi:hypothetical protein
MWLPALLACARPAETALPSPPLPTQAMVQQMIGQIVLDHPAVQPFLHLELPEHRPLALWTAPELAQGAPALTAGGAPVRVVPSPAEARVVMSRYEPLDSAARVRVHVEVPPEGAAGWVEVELRDNVWSATGAQISER